MQSDTSVETSNGDPGRSRGILLADADGNCTHVSQRWTEITGTNAAWNIERGWLAAVHPDDREWMRAQWMECLRKPCEISVDVRFLTPDGWTRRAVLAVSPLRGETGAPAGFVLTMEETNPQKDESRLLHARKMETVGRLTSGVAHDFANLLTLISGYGDILHSRMAPQDPLRAEVDEIRKAATRGSGLTRQLLAFCRRHDVERQVLDLNALVTDMEKMLRRIIGEHIELETHLAPDAGSIHADSGQMEQTILNLALNARDAMPDGGRIAIRTAKADLDGNDERVRQGLPAGAYVALRFEDSGCGMSPDTLGHLFEPFFTTKEKGKGTGLGLATIYSIVKQNGGDVWAESTPGEGAAFTILLPRVAGKSSAETQAPAPRETVPGGETILLVEDEEGVRRLLKHVLNNQGYSVLEAADGEEAVAVLEQHRGAIQLLLTDIVMPRMNGRELVDRAVKMDPALKVVFMSGYTDEVLVGPGKAPPGTVLLQKPLRPSLLATRLREVLDGGALPGPDRANRVASGA